VTSSHEVVVCLSFERRFEGETHIDPTLWGAGRKNIISDRFSTKTAISARI